MRGTMTFKKIVVGTDFSPASDTAVGQAMHIARHTGAEVVLVHAGSLPVAAAEVPESISSSLEEFDALVREAATADKNALEKLRERLDGQGVELSHALVDGFPDVALCETAKEADADLIITGTHGRSGMKRFLLGSVAERVVRLADRSVMVARNDAGRGGFKKLLVPVDFSDLSMRAVAAAMELAAPDAELELLHCWQLPPQGTSHRATDAVLRPILQAISADVDKRGAELVSRYASDTRTIRFHSMMEAPAQGIQDRLAKEDFEIVVMGSHGRRGIRRFLLGSVAEATLRHSTCSVFIAHQPAE